MEKWDKSLREHRQWHHKENPSFSSSLLEEIYRSIDEGETEEKGEKLVYYRESMRKQKQSNCYREDEAVKANFRRARTVENGMEKKKRVSETVVVRRNSLTEFDRRTRSNSNSLSMHSSSSSSDSSSGCGFSSSESESFYGIQRPKPIRTSISSERTDFHSLHGYRNHSAQTQKPKHENGFGKTKSKALRIFYGDLKKAKQPISPGARLAGFLNSLFTTSGKKAKVSNSAGSHESKSAQASTCSSASSFSRSCLSKTPSSRSGAKRSVRFCPVSVIVDEDCRPCGQKNLHGEERGLMATVAPSSALKQSSYGMNSNEELKFHVMQESRQVEEFARDLLQTYKKKNAEHFYMHSEEDDDGAASCSSSDLFELDNLAAIGIGRYREELPVYETTHFNTNRAIANGFIL